MTKLEKVIVSVWFGWTLMWVGILVGIGYIAVHFISKYW